MVAAIKKVSSSGGFVKKEKMTIKKIKNRNWKSFPISNFYVFDILFIFFFFSFAVSLLFRCHV